MLYWIMKHIVVGPYVKAVYRAWVRGIENVPATGPVIIASNHLSVLDSVFMPLEVDRKVTFLAKSEYFTGSGFKGFITKVFMTGIGQIPIDRSGGKASEASLNTALQVLAGGGVLAIYPEGTRSPDGKLYRGRTGVARMILESGAPVIPMVMVDTEKAMPIGSKLPKVHRVGMVFGEPLDFTRYVGMESDRFALRAVTDEIMYELAKLGGQEYVDVYASTVKAPRADSALPKAS